jgi:hypothetical protein
VRRTLVKSKRKYALLSAAALVVAVAAPFGAYACDKAAKAEPAAVEAQGCAKNAEARVAANGAAAEKKPCGEAVAAEGSGCCAKGKTAQVAVNGVPSQTKPCPGAAAGEGSGCPKAKAEQVAEAKAEGDTVAQNGGR